MAWLAVCISFFSVHIHHPPGLRACNGMLCYVHSLFLAFITYFSYVYVHHPPGLRACNGMLCCIHILCFSCIFITRQDLEPVTACSVMYSPLLHLFCLVFFHVHLWLNYDYNSSMQLKPSKDAMTKLYRSAFLFEIKLMDIRDNANQSFSFYYKTTSRPTRYARFTAVIASRFGSWLSYIGTQNYILNKSHFDDEL